MDKHPQRSEEHFHELIMLLDTWQHCKLLDSWFGRTGICDIDIRAWPAADMEGSQSWMNDFDDAATSASQEARVIQPLDAAEFPLTLCPGRRHRGTRVGSKSKFARSLWR